LQYRLHWLHAPERLAYKPVYPWHRPTWVTLYHQTSWSTTPAFSAFVIELGTGTGYYPAYTTKHTWSTHDAHVFNIGLHMHDVCSKFVSSLLYVCYMFASCMLPSPVNRV